MISFTFISYTDQPTFHWMSSDEGRSAPKRHREPPKPYHEVVESPITSSDADTVERAVEHHDEEPREKG